MTLHRQLITSKNNTIDIITEDIQAQEHFNNPSNFADIVLNQINTDRFMDPIFEDEENLTILDIGGNIGLFSLYAQDRCSAIYTIEPTPNHFNILCELTKDYKNVTPLNYAVSNKDKSINFYINEENTTMNSLANTYGKKVKVQAKTIRSIIDELGLKHVDFIKCDIEGSEMIALTHDTVLSVKDIVDAWFIEVHSTNKTATQEEFEYDVENNRQILTTIFSNVGYQVQKCRDDGLYIFKD